MTKLIDVEYYFLQYVPNAISDECVSIAIVVVDAGAPEHGICTMNIATDWETRVRRLDPDTDLEMVAAMLTEIRDRLLSGQRRNEMLRQLEDSFSNAVQVSRKWKCEVIHSPENIEVFARGLLAEMPKTLPQEAETQGATFHKV